MSSQKANESITKEFLKSFLDKYTYNPIKNTSARWALMWCGLFNLLGTIHILFHSNRFITLMVHCVTGIIALLLYPTLGATGTLYKRKEDVIKSYSKNLEELVAQKTKLLRKSEEKYRTLFEIVHTGMFRVNEDLQIVDINKYALDLIGLPYKEVIGRRCLDIICKGQAQCKLSDPCQEITTHENTLNSVNGKENFVVISCRNWKIDGKAAIIGSITNINERKKLERSILEHKLWLESIFDSMEDGIIVINKDNKIASINRRQADILGVAPEDLIGKSCNDFIHPSCINMCEKVFGTGDKMRSEISFNIKGNQVYEDIIFAPVKNKDGESEQVIEVLRDITEKKRMENLLIRSERLASMGEIAACVAHEINNPMGIILGFTQRLLTKTSDDNVIHEELKIIEQESIRCGKIIKNLLDFSRPSIPQKRLVSIEQIITRSVKLIELQINKNKIHIHKKISKKSKIEIDPYQIQQVFMNILLNAIQAMPDGGTLSISANDQLQDVDYPNGITCIEIADTGIGILNENVGLVFEPSFSTKKNGTGLGLSLSKRIVEAHGGALELTSEIGKGTQVIVKLPNEGQVYEKDINC